MLPDPSPDETRTVYCRTCAAWRHPRHACARSQTHETAPLLILQLREKGPLASDAISDEIGRASPEMRRDHAIAKFDLLAHAGGQLGSIGPTHPVYYLSDEHDPATVIEAWIEANASQLAGRGLTTENITRALSKSRFKAAWRELCDRREFAVLDSPDRSTRGGGQTDQVVCPFCGAEVARLPTHVPSCEAAAANE